MSITNCMQLILIEMQLCLEIQAVHVYRRCKNALSLMESSTDGFNDVDCYLS